MSYQVLTPGLQLSIRSGLSAALAVASAEFLRLPHPLYAMIGAVIVTDLSPSQTRKLGLRRLVGSALGALVGAVASSFLPSAPWSIGLSVLVAMFLSHLLQLEGAAKVTGYVCGIVVLGHSGDPWSYSVYRLAETILGVGIAILVSMVPKLIPNEASKQQES